MKPHLFISSLVQITARLKAGSRKQRLADICGALLIVAFGGVLFYFPIGDGIVHWSYDLLFVQRPTVRPKEAVIVYLDEPSYKNLDQNFIKPWDRSLHARLLDRLTADGTKAVVFDIMFSDPGPDDKRDADEKFAQAIQKHGRVILGADYVTNEHARGVPVTTLKEPWERFRTVAADWGVV